MFQEIYKGKKVLITGSTGFKGTWLTSWLLKLGANVVGVANEDFTQPSLFKILNLENDVNQHVIDIADYEKMKALTDEIQPDIIFHLAAQALTKTAFANTLETIKTNVLGSATVLEALRGYQKKCAVVMITSDKCYENIEWNWGYRETDRIGGKDPYSASKGAAELVIHAYEESIFKDSAYISLVTARAGNVIGGGDWAADRVLPDCYRAWSKNLPVTIRRPKAVRPWQHVLEPLSGYLTLGQYLLQGNTQIKNEAFNFGPYDPEKYSVRKVVTSIAEYWSFNDKIEEIMIEEKASFHEATDLKLNCDKSLAWLNWKTVLNFKELMEITANWYAAFYQTEEDMKAYTKSQIEYYCKLAKEQNIEWARS